MSKTINELVCDIVREELAKHVAECHKPPEPKQGPTPRPEYLKLVKELEAEQVYGEQLRGLKAIIAALEEENRESQQRIDWLEGHCLKHQRDLEKSEERVQSLEWELSGMQAVVAVRNAEISALETRVKREVENCESFNRESMKFCQERDAARAECERLRELFGIGVKGCDGGGCDECCPGMPPECGMPKTCPLIPPPSAPPAATGDDDLKAKIRGAFAMWRNDPNDERECEDVVYVAVRQAFDALRRERDDAIEQRNESIGDAEHMADKYHNTVKRAEAAEAELAELRAAVNDPANPVHRVEFGDKATYGHRYDETTRFASRSEAFIAGHKAATAAEGTVRS